jgi:hypothetical protein
MRFEKGTIELSRQIFWPDRQNNDFFGDTALYCIWSTLIAWANWKDGTTPPKGFKNPIKRGQLVTSLSDLSRQWRVGTEVARRCLSHLEKTGRITQQTTKQGRIITLVKYDTWQLSPNKSTNRSTNSQQTTNKRPTNDQQYSESENQRIRESSIPPVGVRGTAVPAQVLFEIWNQNCGSLPKVKALNDDRKRKIRSRLLKHPSSEYWTSTIKRLAASDFACSGKWASFDWLIKNDTNHAKVAEGNYDNKKKYNSLDNLKLE